MKELEVAIAAVIKACRVCVAVQSTRELGSVSKSDKSPVTIADFACQAVVISTLCKNFQHPIIGEEDASKLRGDDEESQQLKQKVLEAAQQVEPDMTEDELLKNIDLGCAPGGSEGYFWALDPIDGTKGFIRGGQYAVALGLIKDGKPILGVLGCPNLPENFKSDDGHRGYGFAAIVGQNSFSFQIDNPSVQTPITGSSVDDLTAFCFAESYESGHSSHDDHAKIAQRLGTTAEPYRLDSQAKYALMARGDTELYLRLPRQGSNYVEKIWDHAAGAAIVMTSGCTVTDAFGKPVDFGCGRTLENNRGIVVSNGKHHDKIIEVVKQVLSERE